MYAKKRYYISHINPLTNNFLPALPVYFSRGIGLLVLETSLRLIVSIIVLELDMDA